MKEMMKENRYNLYCDESCHLQYDTSDVMCVGAIGVPACKILEYKLALKKIKREFGILHEVKWNTISATHIEMYRKMISFFFHSEMTFRSVLIKSKNSFSIKGMDRGEYNQFYFSIIERLIRYSVNSYSGEKNDFRVYLDMKDSHSSKKLNAVTEALSEGLHEGCVVSRLQNIRSHESVFLQLVDILIGAITYRVRGLDGSRAKSNIVRYIEELSGYDILDDGDSEKGKFCIYDIYPEVINGCV